ncbi:MAG TPA: aldehyde dehydrogenase family protein, partial [Rhodothermia bacterium]|nr:aldehyde dehydrogenase family protein [Rhodothermia bacterium]
MIHHFINNQFVPSVDGKAFDTLNPTTNQPITQVASGAAEDVDRAVKSARKAFDEGPWPRMAAEERSKYLVRIGELIEKHADDIVDSEIEDTGIPISQVKKGAIPRAAKNFYFFAEMATKITGEEFPIEG